MSKKSEKIEILPYEIHALWQMVKNHETFENISKISQGFETTKTRIVRIFEVGLELQLLRKGRNDLITLTDEGRIFSQLEHWRLWRPSKEHFALIKKYDLDRLFYQKALHDRPAIIDLFAGVGGLSLGFEAAGFDVALAIDNDPEACEAHRKNFPWSVVRQEGVEKIAADPRGYISKIPELKNRKIAGIVGGPPCQGFSYIGERVVSDERNLLTSRFMDTVMDIEPDFFMMENVPGLASSGIPPKFAIYVQRLAKSIGEPASSIVAEMPKVPSTVAKRDKQFKKRMVSEVISNFKDELNAEYEVETFNPASASKQATRNFNILKSMLIEKFNDMYSGSTDKSLIKIIEPYIATISFSALIENMISNGAIGEGSCEEALKKIAQHNATNEAIKKAISQVCEEYDNAPKGKILFGKKIGPILQHLIERASDKYDIYEPTVLNAADFGAPQSRQRLFFLGVHKRLKQKASLPEKTHALNNSNQLDVKLLRTPTVFDAIADLPDIDDYETLIKGHEISSGDINKRKSSSYSKLMGLSAIDFEDQSFPRPSWNPFLLDCCNRTLHADYVLERLKEAKPGTQDKTSHKTRLHPDKPSCTLRAGTREAKGSHTAVRPVHYEHHRVISVREGGRLMGYPDWMTFHRTKWHGFRLVGNGVPAQLARAVAAQIHHDLYGAKEEKKDCVNRAA